MKKTLLITLISSSIILICGLYIFQCNKKNTRLLVRLDSFVIAVNSKDDDFISKFEIMYNEWEANKVCFFQSNEVKKLNIVFSKYKKYLILKEEYNTQQDFAWNVINNPENYNSTQHDKALKTYNEASKLFEEVDLANKDFEKELYNLILLHNKN